MHEIFSRQLNAHPSEDVQCFNSISELSSEIHEQNFVLHASNSCRLDSSTGRAADKYPEGVSSNPARVNIFQLTSAVSDYHGEKKVCSCISEDDSEIKTDQSVKAFLLTIKTKMC